MHKQVQQSCLVYILYSVITNEIMSLGGGSRYDNMIDGHAIYYLYREPVVESESEFELVGELIMFYSLMTWWIS